MPTPLSPLRHGGNTQQPGSIRGVSLEALRRIWQAASTHPGASLRELCALACVSMTCARAALIVLADIGYVERHSGGSRAYRVIVPLLPAPTPTPT